jgi:hypothetical protein
MTRAEAKSRTLAAIGDWSARQEADRLGKRKPSRQIGKTEHEEQAEVVRWLMDHQLDFVAIPNAGQRSYRAAARLRSEGMQKGFPDLLIMTQAPGRSQARGVAIEMKRFHGGKLAVEQYDWLRRLERCGYLTHVAEGANDAICWLESLGYGR